MKLRADLVVLVLLLFSLSAFAEPVYRPMHAQTFPATPQLLQALKSHFNMNDYREVRIQTQTGAAIVYLLEKAHHKLTIVQFTLSPSGEVIAFNPHYKLQASERTPLRKPVCPDKTTEFIAFAPNDDQLEQDTTEGVAAAAEAAGLKTVRLYQAKATSQTYLDYMSCPALKGNFYDGDANPEEIVTHDGTISAHVILSELPKAFRAKVVNIWLACEAFNDPMGSTMLTGAQSQKFAAGYNDLLVGPSDATAACAMKAAITGSAMTEAFNTCYSQLDVSTDKWGFGGGGSDYFGY